MMGVQYLDQSYVSQFTKKILFWGNYNLDLIWAKIIQSCIS